MKTLTNQQLTAIMQYARLVGTDWKDKLRTARTTGNYFAETDLVDAETLASVTPLQLRSLSL